MQRERMTSVDPDVLRIYRDGRAVEQRIDRLREEVERRRITLKDVLNRSTYERLRYSDELKQFPEAVRRPFDESQTYVQFLTHPDITDNPEMIVYFVKNVATDDGIGESDGDDEKIGIAIQSSTDVAVQQTNYANSKPAIDELRRMINTLDRQRHAMEREFERMQRRFAKTVAQEVGEARRLSEDVSTSIYSRALFDTFLSAQITLDALPEEDDQRLPALHLSDRLYEMYLSKEDPSYRVQAIKRLPVARTRGFVLRDLTNINYPMTFHDVVGRRFLILCSREQLNIENRTVNSDIIVPLHKATSSDVVLRRFPQDFLLKALGYTSLYDDEVYAWLFGRLLGVVREYFGQFNINEYRRWYDVLIGRLVTSKVLPLLTTTRLDLRIDDAEFNDLYALQTTSNKEELVRLYTRYGFGDVFMQYLRKFMDAVTIIYPLVVAPSRIINGPALFPFNAFDEKHRTRQIADALITSLQVYYAFIDTLPVVDSTEAQSVIFMCRAQTLGFFNMLCLSPTLIDFLVRNNATMQDMCLSMSGYAEFVDPVASRTAYSPMMFVDTNMEMLDAFTAVYMYHLLSAIVDVRRQYNKLLATATKQQLLQDALNARENTTRKVVALEDEMRLVVANAALRQTTTSAMAPWSLLVGNKKGIAVASSGAADAHEYATALPERTRDLGSFTQRTQNYTFAGKTWQETCLRFFTLFNVFMTARDHFSPSLVLLYLYLRFTERRRGVDSDSDDRTFETWAAVNQHLRGLGEDRRRETLIAHRLDEKPTYSDERALDAFYWFNDERINADLLRTAFQDVTFEPVLQHQGQTWCHYDIFMPLDSGDKHPLWVALIDALTLNGTFKDAINMQVAVLVDLESNDRAAVFASLVPQCSYMLLHDYRWQRAKQLLWELHPQNMTMAMLMMFAHVVLPERYAYTTHQIIKPVIEKLKTDYHFNDALAVFRPVDWYRGVKYTSADWYMNDVHVAQVQRLGDLLETLRRVGTPRVQNTVAYVLDTYAKDVDVHLFDVWASFYPNEYLSTQVDEHLEEFYKAYNINMHEVFRADELARSALAGIADPFFKKAGLATPAPYTMFNYDFDVQNPYSLGSFLEAVARISAARHVKDRARIEVLLMDVPPYYEGIAVIDDAGDRNYIEKTQEYLTAVNNREFGRAFINLVRQVLSNFTVQEQFVREAKALHVRACEFVVRRVLRIPKAQTTADALSSIDVALPSSSFNDRMASFITASRVTIAAIVDTMPTEETERYRHKQKVRDYFNRCFRASDNAELSSKVVDFAAHFHEVFVEQRSTFEDYREEFLRQWQKSFGALYPLIEHLWELNDAQRMHDCLLKFNDLLATMNSMYKQMSVSLVRWIQATAVRLSYFTSFNALLACVIDARTIKTSPIQLERRVNNASVSFSVRKLLENLNEANINVLLRGLADVPYRVSKTDLQMWINLVRLKHVFPKLDGNYVRQVRRTTSRIPDRVTAYFDDLLAIGRIDDIANYIIFGAQAVMSTAYNETDRVLIIHVVRKFVRILGDYNVINDIYNRPEMRTLLTSSDVKTKVAFDTVLTEFVRAYIKLYLQTTLLTGVPDQPAYTVLMNGDTLLRYSVFRYTLAQVFTFVRKE